MRRFVHTVSFAWEAKPGRIGKRAASQIPIEKLRTKRSGNNFEIGMAEKTRAGWLDAGRALESAL